MSQKGGSDKDSTPEDFPLAAPRDLHPTSDIRFVMVEVGKLTANVERLIKDVGDHGKKLTAIDHKLSFLKGASWVIGLLIPIVSAILWFFLSDKWAAFLAAYKAASRTP